MLLNFYVGINCRRIRFTSSRVRTRSMHVHVYVPPVSSAVLCKCTLLSYSRRVSTRTKQDMYMLFFFIILFQRKFVTVEFFVSSFQVLGVTKEKIDPAAELPRLGSDLRQPVVVHVASPVDLYRVHTQKTEEKIRHVLSNLASRTTPRDSQLDSEPSRLKRNSDVTMLTKTSTLLEQTIFHNSTDTDAPLFLYTDGQGRRYEESCTVSHDQQEPTLPESLNLINEKASSRIQRLDDMEKFAFEVVRPKYGIEHHAYYSSRSSTDPKDTFTTYEVISSRDYRPLSVMRRVSRRVSDLIILTLVSGGEQAARTFLDRVMAICSTLQRDLSLNCSVALILENGDYTQGTNDSSLIQLQDSYQNIKVHMQPVWNRTNVSETVAQALSDLLKNGHTSSTPLAYLSQSARPASDFFLRCLSNTVFPRSMYLPIPFQVWGVATENQKPNSIAKNSGFWNTEDISTFCIRLGDALERIGSSDTHSLSEIFHTLSDNNQGVFHVADPSLHVATASH